MANKWVIRILGIILILVLFGVLMNLQRTLIRLQQQRGGAPATSTR